MASPFTLWSKRHWALYVLGNTALSIGLLAVVAMIMRSPFVFPSLGPTAYLLFIAPVAAGSSPRNVILGHAIGILCGYGALVATGLTDMSSALDEDINLARVIAAAMSLGATGALMIFWNIDHAPACATTLIISLGFISDPLQLLVMEVAVMVLVVQAFVANRIMGIPTPLWRPLPPPESST